VGVGDSGLLEGVAHETRGWGRLLGLGGWRLTGAYAGGGVGPRLHGTGFDQVESVQLSWGAAAAAACRSGRVGKQAWQRTSTSWGRRAQSRSAEQQGLIICRKGTSIASKREDYGEGDCHVTPRRRTFQQVWGVGSKS
jgi:hypothetical protein